MRNIWLAFAAVSLLFAPPLRSADPVNAAVKKPRPLPVQMPKMQTGLHPQKNTDAAAKPTGPAPVIVCDQPQYDFGTAAEGEDVKHVFSVRNKGQGVLKIIQARGG